MTNVLQGSRLCLYRDCGLAFRLAPWRAATRDVREFVWGRPGQVPMVRAGVFDVFAKVPGYASCMHYDSYGSEQSRTGRATHPRGRGAGADPRWSAARAAVEQQSRAAAAPDHAARGKRYEYDGTTYLRYEPAVHRSMPASHSALTSSPMAHKRHHPSGQSLRRGSAAPYPCARAHRRRCGQTPACPECPTLEWSRLAHRTCNTSSPAG